MGDERCPKYEVTAGWDSMDVTIIRASADCFCKCGGGGGGSRGNGSTRLHLLQIAGEKYVELYLRLVRPCDAAPAAYSFRNSTFRPHSVCMCFVWISEQTAIISLCNINWLVFITETESVYCAVRTGSVRVTWMNLVFQECPASKLIRSAHYFIGRVSGWSFIRY